MVLRALLNDCHLSLCSRLLQWVTPRRSSYNLAGSMTLLTLKYNVGCSEEQRKWRQHDVQQRDLDNARVSSTTIAQNWHACICHTGPVVNVTELLLTSTDKYTVSTEVAGAVASQL